MVTQALRKAASVLHHEGGDIGDAYPRNPEQLFAAAGSWHRAVRGNPKPYSVMLAPYNIAVGPEPPNEAALQHQRDVLKRCAQLRSTYFDYINQVDFVLEPNHVDYFDSFDSDSLNALRSSLAKDLDIIAEAASYALSHARHAKEPESYARENLGLTNYHLTVLPVMPKLKPGHGIIAVPNVVGMHRDQAKAAVNSGGFIFRLLALFGPYDDGKICYQRPPAGAYVAAASRVITWVMSPVVSNNDVLEDDLLGSGVGIPDDLPIPPH